MIKFFRLSKLNFAKQNQMSSEHLVEIAPDYLGTDACGRKRNLKI